MACFGIHGILLERGERQRANRCCLEGASVKRVASPRPEICKSAKKFISYDDKVSREYFKARTSQWEGFAIRYLDRTVCGPACIAISKKTIVMFLYTEGKLRVIVSKDKYMVEVYKKHFENLWRMSRV